MTIEYKCLFCDFQTNKTTNLKNHFNKKKVCDLKVKDKFYQYKMLGLCFLCDLKITSEKEHKPTCKMAENVKLNEMHQKLIEQYEENLKLKELTQTNVINQINIQQQQINYNLVINDFDMFSTKHISRDIIFDFFKERSMTRNIQDLNPVMFSIIYCNENSQENHSIYLYGNDIYAFKNKKFVKMSIEEIDLFADNIFKGRVKYKIDEIFEKGHLESDNVTEIEFNEFTNMFENYKIDNRTLKLKFDQFRPILEQNIDIIDNTLKSLNPKYLSNELKQILNN